jgi:hypothetical protein
MERPGAYRSRSPEPGAVMGPPLARLAPAAIVGNGCRGRPRTRAWRSLANEPRCACSLKRTVGGNRDGSRSQQPGLAVAAVVASAAREPPYVCGAAPSGLRHQTESQSAHETEGRRRQAPSSGKKDNNR